MEYTDSKSLKEKLLGGKAPEIRLSPFVTNVSPNRVGPAVDHMQRALLNNPAEMVRDRAGVDASSINATLR